MRDQRILFLGYGFVAKALAKALVRAGWRARATYRRDEQAADLGADGIDAVRWSGGLDPGCFDGVGAILVSTPPTAAGCPALAAARAPLAAAPPAWIGYLSTNGVYGDHGGGVVDETTPLRAVSPRALARVAAERDWSSFAAASGQSLVTFRLPGIYGPGRSAFDQIRQGRAQRICKQGQVFSRMHVDDIAAAIRASLSAPQAGALFNLADDEPAPPQDVIEHACRLIGAEPPPLVAFDEAILSEMARSFYADNKRVSNALMKRALGVTLRYPTYREGLAAILAAERRG